jgi:hypothetical protein
MTWVALAAVLLFQEGKAREVLYVEGGAIEVRPVVATADRHATCVVILPEDSIDSLVAAWNEADLSVEQRRNHLFLKLLRPAGGDLHVLGSSGTLYRLSISPGADAEVRIHRPRPAAGAPAPSFEFVKALRLGKLPADAQARRGTDAVLFRIGATELRILLVVESPSYVGYILEVRNVGDRPHRLDLSKLRSRDLILAGAREHVVLPKSETLLYLVFASRP